MAARVGGLISIIINIKEGSDTDLPRNILLSAPIITGATVSNSVYAVDRTHDDNSGTQPEGAHADIV